MSSCKPSGDQAARVARNAPGPRSHEEQHAHYSHEMSQETSAASGRFIVRTVPLLYGILAGALFGNLYVGLVAGTLVSIALDLTICDRSMCRPLLRRAGRAGCPLLALAAQALAGTIETIGLRPPSLLADARCAPPRA